MSQPFSVQVRDRLAASRAVFATVAVVALLLGVGVGLLSGCSSTPPVTTGTVIDKSFSPAHWESGYKTWTTYDYTCGMRYGMGFNGKYGYSYSCGETPTQHEQYVEHYQWVQDDWSIRLENCVVNTNGSKGKCRRGSRSLTKDDYGRYAIGDHYPKYPEHKA